MFNTYKIKEYYDNREYTKEIAEAIDFNKALGDTIMEKFETMFLKLLNISRQLEIDFYDHHDGHFNSNSDQWVLASPEITSIFQTSSVFHPASDLNLNFVSDKDFLYCGFFNVTILKDRKWHIIKSNLLESNTMTVGIKTFTIDCKIENFVF